MGFSCQSNTHNGLKFLGNFLLFIFFCKWPVTLRMSQKKKGKRMRYRSSRSAAGACSPNECWLSIHCPHDQSKLYRIEIWIHGHWVDSRVSYLLDYLCGYCRLINEQRKYLHTCRRMKVVLLCFVVVTWRLTFHENYFIKRERSKKWLKKIGPLESIVHSEVIFIVKRYKLKFVALKSSARLFIWLRIQTVVASHKNFPLSFTMSKY